MQKNKVFYWLSFNLFVVLSILLVACSGLPAAAAGSTAVPPQVQATSPAASEVPIPTIVPPTLQPTQPPVTLQTATVPKLGSYLTDQNGRTLYVFTQDSHGASNCYASCAAFWSPLSGAAAVAGSGVGASLIGLSMRKDGVSQVTYNGYPLYYFGQDSVPGDMLGQGLQKFWYVISPAGKLLKTAITIPTDAVQLVSAAATAISMALEVARSSKYGSLLTDQHGRTLYMFTQDSAGTSSCTDSCAALWPPVIGPVSAGKGVNASLIGSIIRSDGLLQVTYKGHPLYEFVQDSKTGMISGEGAQKKFYLVSPSGSVIMGALVVHTPHTVTTQPTPVAPKPMPQPIPHNPMGGMRY